MSPYKANVLNALILIMMGSWGYFVSSSASPTILIPVFFGSVFLALTPSLKKDNKLIAHIAAALTLIVIFALFMPLRGSIGRDDMEALFRVSCMLVSSLFAMTIFVKSFIDIRKARQNK